MSMPGRLLSQPAKVTIPSNRSACIIVSIESAMTSRLTSEARMPSWPIEMPSLTAIVTNSMGKPSAARTPSFARFASRSSGMLHGVTSFQLDATPICGFSQSASVMSTAIAVAFARNPMTLAQTAYDLQSVSEGRFILGLGSQIRPHIEKRFSMPWSKPASRMRELALAIRAIWACWHEGAPLRFDGDFYRHTLMTPFFNPGPNPYGPPRMWLAGVGPAMTEVAGEVADGFLVHPFSTERLLREVTLPALERGLARQARTRDGCG